jgi:hypothetical protein
MHCYTKKISIYPQSINKQSTLNAISKPVSVQRNDSCLEKDTEGGASINEN